jgi:O-antigen/teichoic acid export membrane protein
MSKKESIAKGGSSVAGARLLGMLLSFFLFLIIARHSTSYAGIFRTVITYLVIAEFIGMLGMHRWLATEITANPNKQWSIFLATNMVMFVVALLLMIAYLAISMNGIYSADVNLGIQLAILSLIPSGIYQCVQSAFIGIGRTYIVGVYNAAEYIIRCTLSILLIYLNHPITEVIGVFVATRWVVALVGFYQLTNIFGAHKWKSSTEDIQHVLHDAPKFLLIIAGHMSLRNAALVMIPALINEDGVAYFSVAYQLFDMIMIIPSVLAISSNHVFVNMANESSTALSEVSTQLLSVTSMAMFPCIAVTAAFATNFLTFLYGNHYIIASQALAILMVASGITMIDQVLSQVMTAKKDYSSDMTSILVGGISAALLTYILILHSGINGAAIAYLIATLITVVTRIKLLNSSFPFGRVFHSIAPPFMSALLIYLLCSYLLQLNSFSFLATSKYVWIASVPFVLVVYSLFLHLLGGLDKAKIKSIRTFLLEH